MYQPTYKTDPDFPKPQIMEHPCNISITEEAARRLSGRGYNPLTICSHYWEQCQVENSVEFYIGAGEGSVWLSYNATHHKLKFYTKRDLLIQKVAES